MPLQGDRTIIKDRFYSLAIQDNGADAVRVVTVARRSNEEAASGIRNYDVFSPSTEEQVIFAYGENSELHRAYVELVASGAPRISLVAIPADKTDDQLKTTEVLDKVYEAAEVAQPGVIVLWGRGGHPSDWTAGATPDTHDYLPIGFHADMGGAAFIKAVADRTKQLSDRTHPVFTVMGIKPYLGNLQTATPNSVAYENMTAAELAEHIGKDGLVEMPDHEDTAIGDNGAYVTVIGTEIAPTRYPVAWGYGNGASTYGGYLSALPSEVAPTGKQLFNIGRIRYSPTRVQQENLTSNAIVPVSLNFLNQATIVDGLTFGRATSDFTRQSTLRIVFDAVQLVRRAVQNYIGQPYTIQNENAMDTSVSSALRSMLINGALQNAQYIMTPSRRENTVRIDLVLLPAFEVRDIEVSVSVQL